MTPDVPTCWVEPSREGGKPKVYFEHQCTDRMISYSLPGVIWEVIESDPLTIEPSISCSWCGLHGWFRKGKWEPV
jgi:hypothetical protein